MLTNEQRTKLLTNERRSTQRARVQIDACWEGFTAECGGLVVDLSETGCFILASDLVTPNELVRITLNPSSNEQIRLWGQVVYQVKEMGFALRFLGHGEGGDHSALWQLLTRLRGTQEEAKACA
jgi:hypothetical protein